MDQSKGAYVGLAGVTMEAQELSLGYGIKISPTYAHLMAPFMMAFAPAPAGSHHPAPWAAVNGGLGWDITVEVHVPPSTLTALQLNPRYIGWLVAAMLRLRLGPALVVPTVGEQSFSDARTNHSSAAYYPVEVEPPRLELDPSPRRSITETDAAWVARHWEAASRLFQANDAFRMLLEAVDQAAFARHRSLALLWLWGGLEAVFSPDKAELKYRISSAIASFLEPAGIPRMNAQKAIAKLYDSRSAAAHGREDKKPDSARETYSLTRRVAVKIIEDNRVPTHTELEAKLFGADPA